MRLRPALLAVVLALGAGRSSALEPEAPPSPKDPSSIANYKVTRDGTDLENVFIGHFGETLRLYSDWTAEAVMRGRMEVVYFREPQIPPPSKWPRTVELKGQKATVTFHRPAVQIKPEEFIPENFARLRLMQLMVIPKDAPGGFESLGKLHEAKAAELNGAGTPYRLQKVGEYPWTPDSFWVSISTPHRLFQIYTQSDTNYFIFTSGASPYDDKEDDPGFVSATAKLTDSLSTYVYKSFRAPAVEKSVIPDLRFALLPWAGVCAIALALGFLPKKRLWPGRLRLMGRAMFGLTTASLLISGPLLFISWRQNLGRTINEASILLCAGLIMPWICRAISSRLNGRKPWRVFAWSAVANIGPSVAGYEILRDFHSGITTLSGSSDFWMLSLTLSAVGLLNGIAIGLAHDEGGKQ